MITFFGATFLVGLVFLFLKLKETATEIQNSISTIHIDDDDIKIH